MTAFERRWQQALFAALIPGVPGGRLPPIRTLDLAAFWTRYEGAAPFMLRIGLRLAVAALTWMPLCRYGRPFHRLDADRQDAFLARQNSSRLYIVRQLVTVVKLIACFAYFRDPTIQAAVRGQDARA